MKRQAPTAFPRRTNMARAIRIHHTGGPEVLELENVDVGAPGPGQARVRHTYVAVNFIDVYSAPGVIRSRCRTASAATQSASSRRSATASPPFASATVSAI